MADHSATPARDALPRAKGRVGKRIERRRGNERPARAHEDGWHANMALCSGDVRRSA